MIKFIDMTGKTEDEAIRRALEQLGLERDDVSVEILERAKSGFLGIGGSPATVRVSYDDGQPEPKPVKPEPKADESLKAEQKKDDKPQQEEAKAAPIPPRKPAIPKEQPKPVEATPEVKE